MIDTHLHFIDDDYNHVEEIINNAKKNDVNKFLLSSTSLLDLDKTLDMANKYDDIFAVLGFHPEFALEIKDEDLKKLEEMLNNKKVVAIGEIGLDYHYDNSELVKEKQKELFIKQIELSLKYDLPIVVHIRDAINDAYNILEEYYYSSNHKLKGVIHCYSGSLEMAKRFIKIGFYLGIGGVLTFKNSKLKDVVKNIDIKHILLETDSPFLSPVRGSKNEPKNVLLVAEYLKDLLDVDLEYIKKITLENTNRLFDLSSKL